MSTDDQLPARAQFLRPVRSPSTLDTYQRGMRSYEAYCETHGHQPHPPDVRVVASWLDYLYTLPGKQGRPLSPDTVKIYLAAVKLYQLQQRDHDPKWPLLDSEMLRARLAAYRWRYQQDGYAPPVVERFTAGHLLALLGWLDRDQVHGRRDAAMVSMLYGATATRSEVARVRVEDVRVEAAGVRVWFASSGRGVFIESNPGDAQRCPAGAVREYLADVRGHGVADGPLFARMAVRDVWPDEWLPLTPTGVSAVVRRVCAAAGLGAHTAESVRAGSAKDVAEASEGDVLAVADAGGWRDAETARRHVGQRRVHATLLGAVLAAAEPVEVELPQS